MLLRGGTHYLTEQVQLTARHSHLRFVAYPGETPVVSGGVKIEAKWKPYKVQEGGANIWVTDVGDLGTYEPDEVPGLQVGGVRATRARYPNLPGGIEVSPGYDCMIPSKDAEWTPPQFSKYGNVTFYTDVRAAPSAQHTAASLSSSPPPPHPRLTRPPPRCRGRTSHRTTVPTRAGSSIT